MTVPAQREKAVDRGGSVLGFVAESLRRLEDSVARGFADVQTQLSRMPNDYVPRREVERRFDEFSLDVAELRRQREADVQARVVARRWQIGTALTAVGAATGVLAGIAAHFH